MLGELALSLYGAAGRLGAPLAGAFLRLRERRGKEDAARRGERFGVAGLVRPPGELIWVHAASVGETLAALPLIERLAERGFALLLTTGTVTAADVAIRRLPQGARHQFVPIDTPSAVCRFLDHWRPDLAIFAESELWPTMLRTLRRRKLPLAVVNARMSERSFRSWRRFEPLARAVMGRADIFLAQATADADRLRGLGAGRVLVCGNLKYDVPAPPADPATLAELRNAIAARPVLVAASTHPGEEEAVIAAHRRLRERMPALLTIVAPRHPERGEAVAQSASGEDLRVGRRSGGDAIGPETELYVADTIGEMGLWYRLADIAFLGGSLVSRGGQNPIEPAKLRVPVLHGPHVSNFRDVYDALTEAGAVVRVEDGDSLALQAEALIADGARREAIAGQALATVERLTGALDRTIAALEPFLRPLGASDAAAAGA